MKLAMNKHASYYRFDRRYPIYVLHGRENLSNCIIIHKINDWFVDWLYACGVYDLDFEYNFNPPIVDYSGCEFEQFKIGKPFEIKLDTKPAEAAKKLKLIEYPLFLKDSQIPYYPEAIAMAHSGDFFFDSIYEYAIGTISYNFSASIIPWITEQVISLETIKKIRYLF